MLGRQLQRCHSCGFTPHTSNSLGRIHLISPRIHWLHRIGFDAPFQISFICSPSGESDNYSSRHDYFVRRVAGLEHVTGFCGRCALRWWYVGECVLCGLLCVPAAKAQDRPDIPESPPSQQSGAPQTVPAQAIPKDPLAWELSGFKIKLGVQVGLQVVGQWNSWWNLAQTFAPESGFDPNRYWFEGYLGTGFTVTKQLSDRVALAGGISAIASGNARKDVFDAGDSGRVLFETAYAGVTAKLSPDVTLALSGGSQKYKVGNGMLLSLASGNGFERGATVFGPRSAWKNTGILQFSCKRVEFSGFYLEPNELKSSDSHTKLAGANVQVELRPNEFVGVAYINAFQSEYPYIQAPITLIPNGRDGLQVINPYLKYSPAKNRLPGLMVMADYAYEWNPRINMKAWAFSGEVANTFAKTKWMPTLSYTYRYYSGDNPKTGQLERFDALYYEGIPTSFSSGSNGSLAFYNSNINLQRLWLNLVISQRDFLDVMYFHILASQLNSPIQFGQGFRLTFENGIPSVIAGVPNARLADDFFIGYTRVVNRHTYFNAGFAYSFPGKGFDMITNGTDKQWPGAYANVVFNF